MNKTKSIYRGVDKKNNKGFKIRKTLKQEI